VTLAKQFKCPFCANENVVECKMDMKSGVGRLDCRLCGANYQMPIHHLHEPIDVFSEWLDDCEAAARGGTSKSQSDLQAGNRLGKGGDTDEDDDDDNDNIPESSRLSSKKKVKVKAESNYRSLGLDDSDEDEEDEED
jgi:transcription elongation factor Elf1